MKHNSGRALKTIAVMGILAFVLLFLASFALRRSVTPDKRQTVTIQQKYSPFDSLRAWRHLEAITRLGPRPPGSSAAAAEREYILAQNEKAGLLTRRHPLPGGGAEGEDLALLTEIAGSKPAALLLLTGYGTPPVKDEEFTGAHANASGAAWLLELGRALGPRREGYTLLLLWAPAAEPAGTGAAAPGPEALMATLREQERLDSVRAVLEIGPVGDCYLRLLKDAESPEWLSGIVWDCAHRLGYRRHFARGELDLPNRLAPFRARGLPALALRDAYFGGSLLNHRRLWHTAADNLDAVCPASLQAIADVFYHALPAIEGHLDRREREQR